MSVLGWLLDQVDMLLSVLYGMDPLQLALGTAAFAALETTALVGLVVPGDAAVLLAGSTVTSPARFTLVVAAASLGTYAGELGGYGLGRLVGARLRRGWLGRKLGEQRWAWAEGYLTGRGASALVPARFVSVVHAVAPLVAGSVRMPLRRFMFWAGVGAVLWAAFYTAVGTAVGAAYREYRGLGLLVSAVVIAASAAALWWRRLRRRGEAERGATASPVGSGSRTGGTGTFDRRSAVDVGRVGRRR